eukprot:COSAG01_NODE_56030_length_321_cov_0.684685_1_plen_34_part_10
MAWTIHTYRLADPTKSKFSKALTITTLIKVISPA